MPASEAFSPADVFSGAPGEEPPRVLISPHRYIQGKGVLDSLGRYLSILPSSRPTVLLTEGGRRRLGRRIEQSLAAAGLRGEIMLFGGECSVEEVERLSRAARESARLADSVIAVGGGKCLDAGKCIAYRLGVPAVICPTIASTDAPCSAVSVMYTEEGVGKGPEFFPRSPALVVVDTGVIAASPVRHLVAGMADALATCYEARTCFGNPQGRSMVGARMTLAALALAELCAKTVSDHGMRAAEAARRGAVDTSLEHIVEANTLLSGLGFESAGLAAAHAMAAGFTVIPALHQNWLHGELVGVGLVAHLVLEGDPAEAAHVARLLAGLGLPVRLSQIGIDPARDREALMQCMAAAVQEPFARNEPFEVTPERLFEAVCGADRISREALS